MLLWNENMEIEWLSIEVCRGPRMFSTLKETIYNYDCVFGPVHVEREKINDDGEEILIKDIR